MDIKHMPGTLRIKAHGGEGTFTGYASVFGELDQQNEIVAPGAFKRSLAKWRQQGRTPALLWMHDPATPIGIWQAVREDAHGLLVEGRLALGTRQGADAFALIKMGALTGLSIGFRTVAARLDKVRKARVLTDLDLFEISLVTFPANEAARIATVKRDEGRGARDQSHAGRHYTLCHAADRLRQTARTLTRR